MGSMSIMCQRSPWSANPQKASDRAWPGLQFRVRTAVRPCSTATSINSDASAAEKRARGCVCAGTYWWRCDAQTIGPGAPHAPLGIMPLIKRTTTSKTIAPMTALTNSGTKPVPM